MARFVVVDNVSRGDAGLAGWSVVEDTADRNLTVSWHHKHSGAQRAADRLNAGKPPATRSPRKLRTKPRTRQDAWKQFPGRKRSLYPFHLTTPNQLHEADRLNRAITRFREDQELAGISVEQARERLFTASESYRRALQRATRDPSARNTEAANRLRVAYEKALTVMERRGHGRERHGYHLPDLRPVPANLAAHLSRSHGTRFRGPMSDWYLRSVHAETHANPYRWKLLSHRHPGMGPPGAARRRRRAR